MKSSLPRSASPEVNVAAELVSEQKSVTLTSSGMATLPVASAVGLGSVGAFAEAGKKTKSKATTQPRQLCNHALLCYRVDVAAKVAPKNSSATPTLAASILASSCIPASCSFLGRAGLVAAMHSPPPVVLLGHPSSTILVDITISCTSCTIAT